LIDETKSLLVDSLRSLRYPIIPTDILKRRLTLKRGLLGQANLLPVRIAILGGSTASEVKIMLELFLLAQGFQPSIYESGYNRYTEDILFENRALWEFKPDVVYIHSTWINVSEFPDMMDTEERVEQCVHNEVRRFETLWNKIHADLGALIVQNNFDLPMLRPLGNLEAFEVSGRINYLMMLNNEFANYARKHSYFVINDIHYLSAQIGLDAWHARTYWYNFHMAISPTATVVLAQNVSAIVKSAYGKSKKCLVLDLDNTLWGGVVGDDGVQNLVLGRDHPVGEAFLDFQRYVKDLQCRGIILAICSKNDIENAKDGFSHPDSVLKLDDFSAFKASWNSKSDSIREIAEELNVGLDSIVFVDDNPVERELVAAQLPDVATPDVGSDVARFAEILEAEHYFETYRLVQDDLNRTAYYQSNAKRSSYQSSFSDYREFLASLEMTSEIAPFCAVYIDRITQLINKTNQFNLTTKRYTNIEVEKIAHDHRYIALYGRLADKFGDYGLVSVLIGRIVKEALKIDLWIMSCRVFNREMELAMFDALIEACQNRKIRKIIGVYVSSKKNSIVADHYTKIGFTACEMRTGNSQYWQYDIPIEHAIKAIYIRRTKNNDTDNIKFPHDISSVI
jgi:FkbH-like protein